MSDAEVEVVDAARWLDAAAPLVACRSTSVAGDVIGRGPRRDARFSAEGLGQTPGALVADEPRHVHTIRLAERVVGAPLPGDAPPPLFLLARAYGRVVGLAAWTPPWPLCVSAWPANADQALLRVVRAHHACPALLAPAALAERLASPFGPVTSAVRLRLFVLHQVVAPPPGPGAPRLAQRDDVALVAGWLRAFHQDVGMPLHGDAAAHAARFIDGGGLSLWVEPEPTAMAYLRRYGRSSAHVGLVYTPPDRRRRGRAARLVASLSEQALASGCARLSLYADAANPTSTGIYRSVGFEWLEDHLELRFG